MFLHIYLFFVYTFIVIYFTANNIVPVIPLPPSITRNTNRRNTKKLRRSSRIQNLNKKTNNKKSNKINNAKTNNAKTKNAKTNNAKRNNEKRNNRNNNKNLVKTYGYPCTIISKAKIGYIEEKQVVKNVNTNKHVVVIKCKKQNKTFCGFALAKNVIDSHFLKPAYKKTSYQETGKYVIDDDFKFLK